MSTESLRRLLADAAENAVSERADGVAADVVAAVWNAVDDERGRLQERLDEVEQRATRYANLLAVVRDAVGATDFADIPSRLPFPLAELQRYRVANAAGTLFRITARGDVGGELFAGELDGLRSTVGSLRHAAHRGSLNDVRRHLAEHDEAARAGLDAQQKRDGHTGKPGCGCPWCGGENPCAHVWTTALDGENRPALDDDGCTWEHCGICGVPKDVAEGGKDTREGEFTRTPAAVERETDVEPPFGWVPTCDTGRRTGRLCDAHDGDLIRRIRGERP